MVAKIRRNFFQYRMLWERLNRRESEEKALLEELLRNFCRTSVSIGCRRECSHLLVFVGLRCGTIMVARIRRNFCQYRWAPMWDHYGRKG